MKILNKQMTGIQSAANLFYIFRAFGLLSSFLKYFTELDLSAFFGLGMWRVNP
ncbi:MAG: hypothetical protein KDC82_06480 [Bacteroidetes bacterium]|nr:hypothetical protein [Bacteroidota bacterium]